MPACAPGRVTARAAARTAHSAASPSSIRPAIPTASHAEKQSPAPTVSTGFTRGARTQRSPDASQTKAPRAPSVMTTFPQPLRRSARAAATGSSSPVRACASDSFGVSVCTRRNRRAGSLRAGAGFKINGTPYFAASAAAASIAASGTSSWHSTASHRAITVEAARTSSTETRSLADFATAIRFSRVRPPIKISAIPLGTPALSRKCLTSIPSRFSPAFAVRPKSSSP